MFDFKILCGLSPCIKCGNQSCFGKLMHQAISDSCISGTFVLFKNLIRPCTIFKRLFIRKILMHSLFSLLCGCGTVNVIAENICQRVLTRNNKTRYRGLFKQTLQALARCAWINMRRLFLFDVKAANLALQKA